MDPNRRFLQACRREPVDATPVWLMRQAGRYMAAYRALRERYSILELIKSPERAAEVTLQPLTAFDLDAGIIFADILTLPEAMGLELEFISGRGPVFHNPIRTAAAVDQLRPVDPCESLAFTLDAIRLVVRELDGRIPLIGFSGAPFTLAAYAIEGGSSRSFVTAKTFMYQQPQAWDRLMSVLVDGVTAYLCAQIEAGAEAVQLFDSWIGMLAPADFRQYALPYVQQIWAGVETAHPGVPRIYFGTDTAGLLPCFSETGASVIGVDWRIDLARAWDLIGRDRAIQGNLDPVCLFAEPAVWQRAARQVLDAADGQPGHIFNLGHGVLPRTPPEHVASLIDYVHRVSRRPS